MEDFLRVGLELPALASPLVQGSSGTATSGWLEAAAAAALTPCFGALWLCGGPGAAPQPTCDPCTLAGGLVETVPSVVLGVVSVVGPGRNPSVLARDLTALDVVSGGRAAVLLRLAQDPVPDDAARAQLAEATAVCRAVLTEDSARFEGRHFHVAGAVNRPPPVRAGGPPVLVELPTTRRSDARLAGADADLAALAPLADAMVVRGPPDQVAKWRRALDRTGVLHRHRAASGPSRRRSGPRTSATPPPPLVWRGAAARLGSLWTAPRQVADRARALLDAGADGLLVRVGTGDAEPLAESVGALAEALTPVTGSWAR